MATIPVGNPLINKTEIIITIIFFVLITNSRGGLRRHKGEDHC